MAENQTVEHNESAIEKESECKNKCEVTEDNGMKLADWRWATEKGYWDPKSRCWNENLGGMRAYITIRNERRAEITHRQLRASAKRARLGPGCSGTSKQSCKVFRRLVSTKLNAGYQAEPLVAILHELPPALSAAISDAIDAAHLCGHGAFLAKSAATSESAAASPPDATVTDGSPLSAEWGCDAVHAFVELRFDPATQARVGGTANARAAALLGLDHADLLARLARGDAAPLPLPPPDAVAAFLHALGTIAHAVSTSYLRICPPAAPRRAAQPRDARRPLVAGHRNVRLLGDLHAPVPPPARGRSAV